VGSFVVPASRIPELSGLLDGRPLTISLTVPDGPDAVEPATAALSGLDGLHLAAVEVAVPPGCRFGDIAAALKLVQHRVFRYIEVPRDARRETTLDALVGTGFRAKFRTGGLTPEAQPDERELAEAILGAVGRGLAFKCTAGLHHAIRHTDGDLEQHGFVNVLLATDAARCGLGIEDLVEILAQRSERELVQRARRVGERRLSAAGSSFVSFGTCSIADPVADLVELGLIESPERASVKENAR
jgi:hypothetical protein